jgi:hypothetical protein
MEDRLKFISHLPFSIRTHLENKKFNDEKQMEQHVKTAISTVVSKTSTSQTIKGLFSGGMYVSVSYAARKIMKGFKS